MHPDGRTLHVDSLLPEILRVGDLYRRPLGNYFLRSEYIIDYVAGFNLNVESSVADYSDMLLEHVAA